VWPANLSWWTASKLFCIIISGRQQLCAVLSRKTVFHKAFSNLSAFSLDHLSVSSRHTRASNENKFMSLPVRTDVFKYSFFPRTITDWNFLPLAVRLLQSTQSFHGALLNSASSNHCWSSWHSGSNGWSAPIAGHRTEEPLTAWHQFSISTLNAKLDRYLG